MTTLLAYTVSHVDRHSSVTYRCKVQASPSCQCADQQDEVVPIWILKLVNHFLSSTTVDFARQ